MNSSSGTEEEKKSMMSDCLKSSSLRKFTSDLHSVKVEDEDKNTMKFEDLSVTYKEIIMKLFPGLLN